MSYAFLKVLNFFYKLQISKWAVPNCTLSFYLIYIDFQNICKKKINAFEAKCIKF